MDGFQLRPIKISDTIFTGIIAVTFVAACVLFGMFAPSIFGQTTPPAPQQRSFMYTPDRIRDDFDATDQQTLFQTQGPVRSDYVEVFLNGNLQRAGKDYTTQPVSGTLKVTFLAPCVLGWRVTLFYYR